MTDKKSNNKRRKLLKLITTSSGAIVAGKAIPESWSKPVVNSILLPVHASTTLQSCSECGVILGRSITCNSQAAADVFYEIEVVDGCVMLNEVSIEPAAHPLYLKIRERSNASFAQITLELFVNGVDDEVDDDSQLCSNPANSIRVSDLPGGGVTATFTWTRSATDSSVTVSDIIICPDAA